MERGMSEMAGTVMLVEDSEDDAELAIRALRQAGVSRIRVARDGEEALDQLFGRDGVAPQPLPQLVLLDIKLPKVDGLEVLRRMRADVRTRRLPAVILSSSDVCEDVARAYELGANSYVCKPVEFARYAQTVRDVAHYWMAVNEPPGEE
jgi:CheY-like chemotaxis protein